MQIERHRAAIRRREPSLPVKCIIRDQLLEACSSFFDYGCGHGEDVRHLGKLGLDCDGWDPVFRPRSPKGPADAVNLGYVLNVIEDVRERSQTLHDAWKLCGKVMSVAARILVGGRGKTEIEYGDGVLTKLGTFQEFFTQAELREYIESELGTEAVPAALGVFYVFRDAELRERFLAARYRRRSAAPRKRVSEVRFEQHRELLEPLIEWIADQGRPPEPDEFQEAGPIIDEFGSLKRAFALIRRVTGSEAWDRISQRRTEVLLVYLALARLRSRPTISKLPIELQRDIRWFFGNYTKACRQADDLLFRAGNADAIDEACRRSSVGKLLPNALYVHQSALESLESILRVYEGCGRAYLGEIDSANIVKIHRFSGKVSYLVYPDFETDPHPSFARCVKLSMRTRDIECYDYADAENPPILHCKETFLQPDHPLAPKFARLTRQEEMHGLLSDAASIGTRAGWESRLQESGFALRGHRLCRRQTRDLTAAL